MKNINFYLAISLSFIVLTISYFSLNYTEQEIENPTWKTYVKKDEQAIEKNFSQLKREELKIVPKRKISSIKRDDTRRIIASKKTNSRVNYKNKVAKDWRKKLSKEVFKFMPEDSEVHIRLEESLLRVHGNKGQYLEHVAITIILPSGLKSSYKALVDSESGKIIRTWDRTLFEKNPLEIKMKPSGTI